MKRSIEHSAIKGTVKIPSSKSVVQRALAIALLAKGRSVISNVVFCDDVMNAVKAVETAGAKTEITGDRIIIESGGPGVKDGTVIECGESALCFRMFSAISALSEKKAVINASGTLRNRSVEQVERSLIELGASCISNDGKPPLTVQGPFKYGNFSIDGSSTSQFLTGLLIALSSTGKETVINVNNLSSRPYIDITIALLEKAGIKIDNLNYEKFIIPASTLYPLSIKAEGDWSGAAFPSVAGAICGSVELTGLDISSVQGDKAILHYLEKAGACISVQEDRIKISKNILRSFEADCTETPDLFPPLTALAVHCAGTSIIHGVHRLRNKESDRAAALMNELRKLGIDINISDNDMIITGGKMKGGDVFSHNDHRMAMALAVTALNSERPVTVDAAQCVNKSWPGFFEMLSSIGGKIS